MTIPPTPPTADDNPIYVAERTHLEKVAARTDHWGVISAVLVLAAVLSVALTVGLFLMGRSGSLTSVNLRETSTFFSGLLRTINSILAALVVIEYLVMLLRSLLLASNTITREQTARTWDTLVLTHVDDRSLIYGKWWAVMTTLTQRHQISIYLRAGVWLYFGLTPGVNGLFSSTPNVILLALAPVIVLAFTLINLGLTTAIGVLASFSGKQVIALTTAVGLQLGLLLVVFAGDVFVSPLFIDTTVRLNGGVITQGIGSGTSLALVLIGGGAYSATAFLDASTIPDVMPHIITIVIATLLYGGLTWLLLWIARALAVENGAISAAER